MLELHPNLFFYGLGLGLVMYLFVAYPIAELLDRRSRRNEVKRRLDRITGRWV